MAIRLKSRKLQEIQENREKIGNSSQTPEKLLIKSRHSHEKVRFLPEGPPINPIFAEFHHYLPIKPAKTLKIIHSSGQPLKKAK